MKNKLIILFLIIFALEMNVSFAQDKYALVVGNEAYPSKPLLNPLNDAKAISAKLTEVGFKVSPYENLSLKDFKNAVRDFAAQLKEGDIALFYYSGHGTQLNDVNYLMAIDSDPHEELEISTEAFNINFLFDKLASKKTVNIVILDACRNNPFGRSFSRSAASEGMASLNAPENTFIAFSTSPGKTASDGSGNNSPFTASLVNSIATDGLSIDSLFTIVRTDVRKNTGGNQTPWQSSSLFENFCFKNCNSTENNDEGRDQTSLPPTMELAKSKIESMIRDYYDDAMNSSISELPKYFAFPVANYFGDLNFSREQMVAQARGYYALWNSRQGEFKEMTFVEAGSTSKKLIYTFVYKFNFVSVDGKKIKGKSTNTVTVEWINDRYLFTSINEKISRVLF